MPSRRRRSPGQRSRKPKALPSAVSRRRSWLLRRRMANAMLARICRSGLLSIADPVAWAEWSCADGWVWSVWIRCALTSIGSLAGPHGKRISRPPVNCVADIRFVRATGGRMKDVVVIGAGKIGANVAGLLQPKKC